MFPAITSSNPHSVRSSIEVLQNAVLVAVAAGVDEAVAMGQIRQVGPEDQVDLGVHEHQVLPALECGDREAGGGADAVRRLDEHVRALALGEEHAVAAHGDRAASRAAADRGPSRRRCRRAPSSSRRPGPLELDVRDADTPDAGGAVALVEETLAHRACAHDDDADLVVERIEAAEDPAHETCPRDRSSGLRRRTRLRGLDGLRPGGHEAWSGTPTRRPPRLSPPCTRKSGVTFTLPAATCLAISIAVTPCAPTALFCSSYAFAVDSPMARIRAPSASPLARIPLASPSARSRTDSAFAFGEADRLLLVLLGDLDADLGLDEVLLLVGLGAGLLGRDARLLGLLLLLVHRELLLGDDLLRLRVHQLLRQLDLADQHRDALDVVLLELDARALLGLPLLLLAVLEEVHRRGGRRLVAERGVDHRVDDVHDQVVDRADLGDHVRRLVRPHPDDDLDRDARSRSRRARPPAAGRSGSPWSRPSRS